MSAKKTVLHGATSPATRIANGASAAMTGSTARHTDAYCRGDSGGPAMPISCSLPTLTAHAHGV